jgi:putative Ca2+/H+ antiporter (TMEM165/GDT1 family)
MEAFLVSAGIVAISEIGDKTQLLALMLAARFKRPAPIILGILAATVLNHLIAALLGGWIASSISPEFLRWGLGGLFIAIGVWALIPDKLDDEKPKDAATIAAIFWVTCVSFFLAEIGDKTQIATAALAARYQAVVPVVMGTTLGMLLADVPAVYLGRFASVAVQAAWVRYLAAVLFIGMGLLTIGAQWFGF